MTRRLAPVGDHGVVVMAAREGIAFETALVSDRAPVVAMVRARLGVVCGTHALRDPTRGGLATALCEIAQAARAGIVLEESEIPTRLGVVAGDLETERDADRLRPVGAPAVAIATGSARHLDAELVHKVLHDISVEGPRLPLHRERREPRLPGDLRPRPGRQRRRAPGLAIDACVSQLGPCSAKNAEARPRCPIASCCSAFSRA